MGLLSSLFGGSKNTGTTKRQPMASAKSSSNSPKYTLDPHKDIEQQMIEQNMFGYRDRKERLKQQDDLLRIACDAREKFKSDGNIEAAIEAYEKVMVRADPPLNSMSHSLFLADLYIKNGQNDKAWGYLNMLQKDEICPVSKIREQQARILKKEKKHKDAIEMILLQHWNRNFEMEYGYYNHNACMKDIGPSIRALKWTFEDQEKCVSFVDFAVSQKSKADEMTITNLYRKFVKDKEEAEH